MIFCVAGLWGLALHHPLDTGADALTYGGEVHPSAQPAAVAAMSSPTIESTTAAVGAPVLNAAAAMLFMEDIANTAYAAATSAATTATMDTCLNPSSSGNEQLCLSIVEAASSTITSAVTAAVTAAAATDGGGGTTLADASAITAAAAVTAVSNLSSIDISHPLEQCQPLLLHTMYLMFPNVGPGSLHLNIFLTRLMSTINALLHRYVPHADAYFTMRCTLFFIGLGINGPKTLVALELIELSPKRFAGTLNGVAGLLGQFGAARAGTFIGLMIVHEGYCSVVAIITLASVVLTLVMFLAALI